MPKWIFPTTILTYWFIYVSEVISVDTGVTYNMTWVESVILRLFQAGDIRQEVSLDNK